MWPEGGRARPTLWPSLPPGPSLDWSSPQAAWSPAPALRTTLTPSATPAPVWSTSPPATQAAQTGWSRRLWTKARWVRPLAAPSASHGLSAFPVSGPVTLPSSECSHSLALLSVCLLLADGERYSLNKLSLPAWAQPCASAQRGRRSGPSCPWRRDANGNSSGIPGVLLGRRSGTPPHTHTRMEGDTEAS